MSVSKKARFEIFKRDSFTCQYCGKNAPDVILELDHIAPISKGGEDDILNLITSCFECNRGKGARELSDNATMNKRHAALVELQERREQIEMLVDWHKGLMDIADDEVNAVCDLFEDLVPDTSVNDCGRQSIANWIRKYGLALVMESLRASVEQYEELEKIFNYIPRIASVTKRSKDKPYLRDLYYIRGILRKRLSYVNDWLCIQLMESALDSGVDIDYLKDLAIGARNWTEWRESIESEADRGDD